jgi:probable HAF family extracellular repeat protein
MKLNRTFVTVLLSVALTVLASASLALPAFAQSNSQQKPNHHQYKLYDVGTFGGPQSFVNFFTVSMTPPGGVGTSDTPTPDPFSPNCIEDCFVKHAVQWQEGVATDLGALPGNSGENSSFALAINNAGLAVGVSENGAIDPLTGYPEADAVVWESGNIINLGTFGGTQSYAAMVNNRGQVVGTATNTVADAYSFGGFFPSTTQSRAFLLDHGVMQDLGTLGGPDSSASVISQSGRIAGSSYTNDIANSTTGIPTIHPFLWDKGQMIDLGSFGGTIANVWDVNNKGQVVGYSFLPGDQSWRGFLWDRGVLIPASLGGHGSYLGWLTEAGDAAGGSFLTDEQTVHTTLWKHGKLIDIGALGQDTCAQAYGINNALQVVGTSSANCAEGFLPGRAFLWEDGGPMVDLNALVENQTDLVVWIGTYIADNGEIIGQARTPSGDIHMVVLVPDGSCNSACEQRISAFENRPAASVQPSRSSASRVTAIPGMGRGFNPHFNPLGRRGTNSVLPN